MSFALSWEPSETSSGGFLYFDAVLSWNRSYTGSVTRHPVDSGGSITDHFIRSNPVFTLSAVVSGTDLSLTSALLTNEVGDTPINVRTAPSAVGVGSTDQSLMMKFIPNVIGQFIPDTLPEVQMDGFRSDSIEEVQDILVSLQSGEGLNQITGEYETRINTVNLYETNGLLSLVKKLPKADSNSFLVITNVAFREDVDTGYALYADITFEQVTFAVLKMTNLPQEVRVKPAVKKKVATKKSVGRCDSTIKDSNSATNTDPQQKKDAAGNSQSDVDPLRTVGS